MPLLKSMKDKIRSNICKGWSSARSLLCFLHGCNLNGRRGDLESALWRFKKLILLKSCFDIPIFLALLSFFNEIHNTRLLFLYFRPTHLALTSKKMGWYVSCEKSKADWWLVKYTWICTCIHTQCRKSRKRDYKHWVFNKCCIMCSILLL